MLITVFNLRKASKYNIVLILKNFIYLSFSYFNVIAEYQPNIDLKNLKLLCFV